MKTSKMKGFTLIELIVVIAIIGVLAAILVPSMIGYVGSSKLATANSNAKLAFENAATYCTESEVAGYTTSAGQTLNSVDLSTANTSGAGGTYVKDGSHLKEALGSLMGGTKNAGFASVKISDAGVPSSAAWAKTTQDLYVGQYPNETTTKTTGGLANASLS